MKFHSLLLFVFLTTLNNIHAQNKGHKFGEITLNEKNLVSFEGDEEAKAVVLYERGHNSFKIIDDYIRLVKIYHIKIKVLDKEGFDEGNIEIPYYHNDRNTEKLTGIKAVIHNDGRKTNVLASQMYTTDINENWKKTSFTFPGIKVGSILEYQYKIISPFFFNFEGWYFQSNIPKVYSEFNAEIPGNYVYNRDLIGDLKISTNEATIKKDCFSVPGSSKDAGCEVLKYAMKNIPAFKAEEDYMLSQKNYISRLEFELSEYHRFDGTVDKYSKTWKDVDKEFKSDKDIGTQLTKKNFFEKKVPPSLLVEGDPLTRAKNIYSFVQNHYTWNGKHGIYRNIRIKKAFEEKQGNVGEINISLINLLNSAGIKTNLMLLSTRNHGLPKTHRPVMSDFNYVAAITEIDGKTYLLDASDKFVPFGYLPYKCLNYHGRVMDFKNESYWHTIDTKQENRVLVRGQMNFDPENEIAEGKFNMVSTGYSAIRKRRKVEGFSEDDYLDNIESASSGNLIAVSHKKIEERSNEEKVTEQVGFEIENISSDETLYLNPILVQFFDSNPFLLEERTYPIDFGHKINFSYNMIIAVPEGYAVDQLPENILLGLPSNTGLLKFENNLVNNTISVYFNLSLNRSHYPPEYYPMLKELFSKVVSVQENSIIKLKKQE